MDEVQARTPHDGRGGRTRRKHLARTALALAWLVAGVVLLSAGRLTLALVTVGAGALLAGYWECAGRWEARPCFPHETPHRWAHR